MSSTNFKCISLLNLLRFQSGELEERVFDVKVQDFMAAAKSVRFEDSVKAGGSFIAPMLIPVLWVHSTMFGGRLTGMIVLSDCVKLNLPTGT